MCGFCVSPLLEVILGLLFSYFFDFPKARVVLFIIVCQVLFVSLTMLVVYLLPNNLFCLNPRFHPCFCRFFILNLK